MFARIADRIAASIQARLKADPAFLADAVVERITSDPEFILRLFQNLRVSAALRGCLATGERFRELKGLPGVPQFENRQEMHSFLLRNLTPSGAILEFGVAAGESARHIGQIIGDRQLFGFDSFEGLPEPWHEHATGEYSQNGELPAVPSNVTLVKGWFQDTLESFIEQNQNVFSDGVAYLHLDADIYSATAYVLDKLKIYLKIGTVIVFDEFWNTVTWEQDEYKAWTEFLLRNPSLKFSYLGYVPSGAQLAVRVTAL